MAITLQLTDGTTTADLCDLVNSFAEGYAPETVPTDKTTVTETIKIAVKDTSLAAVIARIRAIQLLFKRARDWVTRAQDARVYLYWRPNGSLTLYRALVHDGDVKLDAKDTRLAIVNNRFELGVIVTREQFHAQTEVQVQLANAGAKTSSALTIEARGDAGHYPYAIIDGPNDVGGTDNALIRFALARSSAGSNTTKIFMGLGAYQNFTNFPHILEGEDASSGVTLTPTANANCSNGKYAAITGITATDCVAAKWTLTSNQAIACAGQRYRVLARFHNSPPSSSYASVAVYPSGGVTAAQTGPSIALTTERLQDLGDIYLPPWLPMEDALDGCDIGILAHHTGGGGTLDLDFIAIMPTDFWCVYKTFGGGLANTDLLVDDGAKRFAWHQTAAGLKSGIFQREGAPLRLVPGRTQRIYIYAVLADGTAPISVTHTLLLYKRESIFNL